MHLREHGTRKWYQTSSVSDEKGEWKSTQGNTLKDLVCYDNNIDLFKNVGDLGASVRVQVS